MDEFPPSYQSSVRALSEYWTIISQYIPSSDLCSASRVCRRWHAIFAPILWGNPASHWGIENDQVYIALTRFKRTLKWARLSVRELCHTLHLPPAQAELYDGPHAEWLRDVLESLPNLQSLIVSKLPFFDHQSLLALRHYSHSHHSEAYESRPMFPLRLLIAAQCRNSTALGLAEALSHLPNLAYLDLSFNSSARDHSILSKLEGMSNLHILRLQNCLLRDSDMEVLAVAIGRRVRSLDIRGNYLTDASIRTLLQYCFQARDSRSRAYSGVEIMDSADWPVGFSRPDVRILDEFRNEAFNECFVKRLTKNIVNRLPSQDLRQSGVTHLYVAHNQLSVEGVSGLIRNARFYVLDVGSFQTSKATSGGYLVSLPGAEKLPPILEGFGKDLRFLRLHHSVATQEAALKDEPTTPSTTQLEGSVARSELDSIPVVPELPIEEPAPRYELPGDKTQIVLSPAIGEKPSPDRIDEAPNVKRGSAFAPEAVFDNDDEDADPILTATGLGTRAQAMNGINPDVPDDSLVSDFKSPCCEAVGADTGSTRRNKQLQNLQSQQVNEPHGLLPRMLPRLRTLVLTGVPCFDSTGVIDFLIRFIEACALEAEISKLERLVDGDALRIPNTWHGVPQTFPLRRILLELGPPGSTSSRGPKSPHAPQTPLSASWTKSSTEDPDSEALWSAQENDFSFFDDDEECGLPAKERHHFPLSTLSEKVAMPSGEHESLPTLQDARTPHPATDVVQELAKFRKDRKATYENAVRSGETYVKGYWPGEIKILRWDAKSSPHADYY